MGTEWKALYAHCLLGLDARTIGNVAFCPYICSQAGPELFPLKQPPGPGIFKVSTKTSSASNCSDYRVGGEIKIPFVIEALEKPLLDF